MNIVAPRPKKATHYYTTVNTAPHNTYPMRNTSSLHNTNTYKDEDEEEACQELRQILASQSVMMGEQWSSIARTNNPLPNDTSFLPTTFKQAVSQHLSTTTTNSNNSVLSDVANKNGRQRSFSVNDSRNYPFKSVISLVH
ncbi:hypothetical protein BDF20DRAFT_856520 [Mycotypha africana]|uniref:uncharacterized protein n=1 Tax=Mycotypha africana TaxID=64632 RepID=UPI002300755D|nr:uncharacterized protein BDF20DRAFT_856520 [Mycotypha africana]KAI8988577.1 hypothetical protein BDF20DRAFT_856520 [Mycotypha africana]